MASTSLLAEISVPGKHLCGLTWKDDLLWFSDAGLNEIIGVSPQTGALACHIECPEVRTGLTVINGDFLQVVGVGRALRLIDCRTNEAVREFPNPRPGRDLCDIESTSKGVWLGYEDPPMLELRGLQGFELLDNIPVDEPVAGVTVVNQYVAYSCYATRHIHVVDPVSKEVATTMEVLGNPTGLTWDGSLLWYCDYTNVRLRALELPALLTTP
jgi:hypothetical protein